MVSEDEGAEEDSGLVWLKCDVLMSDRAVGQSEAQRWTSYALLLPTVGQTEWEDTADIWTEHVSNMWANADVTAAHGFTLIPAAAPNDECLTSCPHQSQSWLLNI